APRRPRQHRGARGRTPPEGAGRGRVGHRRAVDTAPPRPHGTRAGPGAAHRGRGAGVGARAGGRPAGRVHRVDVHRGAVARDGVRIAVRGRPVPGRVRRTGRGGRGGDGVVGGAGQARTARTDGCAPG